MSFYITTIKININFQGLISLKKEKEITPLVSGEMILRGKYIFYIPHCSQQEKGSYGLTAIEFL